MSETDHPRQRTVAELLAQHGDAGSTGRRRRRRESEDEAPADGPSSGARTSTIDRGAAEPAGHSAADEAAPFPGRGFGAPPATPEPAPAPESAPAAWDARPTWGPTPAPVAPPATGGRPSPGAGAPPNSLANGHAGGRTAGRAPAPGGFVPWPASGPNGSTAGEPADGISATAKVTPVEGAAGTVAMPAKPRPDGPKPLPAKSGPVPGERPTDVMPRYRDGAPAPGSVAPGSVEDGFTAPMPKLPKEPVDDGPATVAAPAPGSAGADPWQRDHGQGWDDGQGWDGGREPEGPPLPPGPVDEDDDPAGLGETAFTDRRGDGFFSDAPSEPARGRMAAVQDAAGTAWAVVVGQWLGGALGGALLWVLFRYLWRSLPVVALAAAVLATVGLVVLVRAMLRNNDVKTTVFAVLVGLLLTVSPAILVLLGR